MRPRLGLLSLIAAAIAVFWQSSFEDPFLSSQLSGVLLLFVGLLAGLRIGTDSATRFTKDLTRLNKVVVEQNRELLELNQLFVRQSQASSQ